MHVRAASVAAGVFLLAGSIGAQKPFELTIDNIMRGPGLVGYPPSAPRWSADSKAIYFDWKQPSDPVLKPVDTYIVNRDGSGLRKLTEDEARLALPNGGDESKDHSKTVFVRGGDLYLYDRATLTTRRLTKTADIEQDPHFTRDDRHIWYTRANNLYLFSLADGFIDELTDIYLADQKPPPKLDKKGTESQEVVKKEERELLDVVQQRAAVKEEEEARKKRDNPRKPMLLEARQKVNWLALSPDEKTVIASISEAGKDTKKAIVPNFVTESGYTEDIESRNKVGDVQNRVRMALIGAADGGVKWVDSGQKKDVALSRPEWSEDGTRAVLFARATDNKNRWLLTLDPATGKTRVLVAQHDDAWLDGPGSSTLGWMKSDRDVFFQSERDGYSHLYTVPYDGGDPKQLTEGKWEILSVKVSRDKSTFYLTSNKGDPAEVHFYSMPAAGGPMTRLTTMPGNHRALVSPDEQWIADIYSYTTKPPELFSMENRAGAGEKKLTSSPSPEFWSYPWLDAPITHFQARDGVEIPTRIYKASNFPRGGPAVIFVHGAGYLQNVHRWWSMYYRELMFHNFLMQHGYLVIDVDYRGSAGYGRDWRTAIYRHMGGVDLDDQVDAAKWLVSQHGVDAKRIGIYGGSYGGFITLMAMFTQPDVFAAGAALRPVTDWAHYNNGYTSDILNTPQKDAEAYRQSSPIFFAPGLKGALLICHGMVDTNVHFQDTVRLVQKLIELRKTNWDVAFYPVEDHGFVQPTSWADEYKRIFALFEKNLK